MQSLPLVETAWRFLPIALLLPFLWLDFWFATCRHPTSVDPPLRDCVTGKPMNLRPPNAPIGAIFSNFATLKGSGAFGSHGRLHRSRPPPPHRPVTIDRAV